MAEQTSAAVEAGKDLAKLVLQHRERRRETRRDAIQPSLATARSPERLGTSSAVPPGLQASLGPPSKRVLIAEGDSWFDFPFSDVLKELDDHFGFDVHSVSHRGDTVEEMAYTGGQLDGLVRAIEKTVRHGVVPEAILLSGGGNDIAGDEFAVLLNHARSPSPGLNHEVVSGVIRNRLRHAYIVVLTAVTEVCQQDLGNRLPILLHGYDYAVPDGRGFWGGWGPLPGPWLEPGLRRKGYADLTQAKELVKQLIDVFNDMLNELPQLNGFEHVRYVDLRNTLPGDPDTYKNWWKDELHPTEAGFEKIAAKFVAALS